MDVKLVSFAGAEEAACLSSGALSRDSVAPLNELPVSGSTPSSRDGKGGGRYRRLPRESRELFTSPGSFTTSRLSLLFSPHLFMQAEESAHCLCAAASLVCGCSDIGSVLTIAYGDVCSLTSCVLSDPVLSSAACEACPHVLLNTWHGSNINPHLLPLLMPHQVSPPASPLL